jgi:hypothetical protein
MLFYAFAMSAFWFEDDMYFDPNIGDGERTSSSMLETFMTTMNYGMRNGGGIGDTLIP